MEWKAGLKLNDDGNTDWLEMYPEEKTKGGPQKHSTGSDWEVSDNGGEEKDAGRQDR